MNEEDRQSCNASHNLLKEFLLGKIHDNNEVRNTKLDALRTEILSEIRLRDKALELQAKEYERRLELLNHENARIIAAGDKAVTRDTFDGFKDSYTISHTQIQQDIEKRAYSASLQALKEEFSTYQGTQSEALKLAVGTKIGSNKVMALVVSIVAFVWAATAVINNVADLYTKVKPPAAVAPAVTDTSELTRLRQQQTQEMDALRREADPTPTPTRTQ